MSRIFSLVLLFFMSMASTAAWSDSTERPTIDSTITFFYYKDLASAADFYRDVVGLEATTDMGWVKIFKVTESSSVGLVEDGKGFLRAAEDKPVMLSLVTDDVDAWHERLVDADAPVLSELPPADRPEDTARAPIRGFIVADPGGYAIEFFSWQ